MFAKFSVKKPYYVFVAVIIVLILGGVSLSTMKTDLLPEFESPYLAVMTTDVGASPEQVETDVTNVLEGSLGTVSGVKSVYSTSAENYSMIFLEFNDDTDMNSAMVKVSAAINSVSSQLPDEADKPTCMEMSMDMMASMYLGVTSSEKDVAELTKETDDEVIPLLQRQEGVANVTSAGFVTDTLQIKLNQDKIDNVNDGILGEVNDKLADAKKKLDDAEAKLDNAEKKIKKQQKKLKKSEKKAFDGFNKAKAATSSLLTAKSAAQANVAVLSAQVQTLQAQLTQLQEAGAGETPQAKQVEAQITSLQSSIDGINQKVATDIDAPLAKTQEATDAESSTTLSFAEAESQLSQALSSIDSSRSQLSESRKTYETQRKDAVKQANIDKLMDASTLSQLIAAQNLEMPAGYVEDSNEDEWVVKVGTKYKNKSQLEDMVLTKVDGVGDITLGDVADIVGTDDSGDSYTKVNGNAAIILSVTKASTANTSEMSKNVKSAISEYTEAHPDTEIIAVMDQGQYIDTTIQTILTSLLLGALLAFVVLAIFLRNWRPTVIVAFSIPFSVLCALVVMYFCGLTLNMMTLGALSLAIGMLVDNSIVVMENIYRMRARGLSAPRAAAQGAMQVSSAVIASTITSVCVFLPFVFANGTVRQLMVPFALTLTFALVASLIVALSVVPALGSKLMKGGEAKEAKWFLALKDRYEHALSWALDHRAPVMVVSVALLLLAGGIVARMGIVMIPEMTSEQVAYTVEMEEGTSKDDAYDMLDLAGKRIAAVEGIDKVGIVDAATASSTTSSSMGTATASSRGSRFFYIYATIDTTKVNTEPGMIELGAKIEESVSDIDAKFLNASSMESMSALSGGDATVEVSGPTSEGVIKLSDKVVKAMKGVEGYDEVENGQEDADETLHLVFDKNKLARMGTTVGQVYQTIQSKLDTEKTAITLSKNRKNVDVTVDASDVEDFTRENILSMKFEDGNGKKRKLSEVAEAKVEEGVAKISKENQVYTTQVTAKVKDGYNITLLARELQPAIDKIDVPSGYSIDVAGTNADITEMMEQMLKLLILGFVLLYLVMVAQFQNLKSPFIIIFTVPLAFTGGLLALAIAGEQLSMMAMLGFVILMGTVVNNGIVFVDYANQLRLGGMDKRAALIATGRVRMRPILMTALTTIISMCALIFSQQIGSSLERGMALVVAGGLLYATFMTLFVVPIVYDFFNRKPMRPVDVGSDVDDDADDAAAFIAIMGDSAREKYLDETRSQYRKRRKQERAERLAERKARRGRKGKDGLQTYGQREAGQDKPSDDDFESGEGE